jgi:hypothetical protein
VLFEHIGTERSRGIAHEDCGLDSSLEAAVQSVLAAHPAEFAEAAGKFSIELHQAEPALLARARGAIRSGRDIEQIGRVLVSVGHLSEEGKAAGHFLVGFARRFHHDEGGRNLELARMSYRNVGLRDMEALSALGAKAADLALSDAGSNRGIRGSCQRASTCSSLGCPAAGIRSAALPYGHPRRARSAGRGRDSAVNPHAVHRRRPPIAEVRHDPVGQASRSSC